MKIETKIDVGDNGYFMKGNEVQEEEVREIRTESSLNGFGNIKTTISYVFRIDGVQEEYGAGYIYKTKIDLLDNL